MFAVTEAETELANERFERFRRTRLPLAAANFVLSLALVIGAARTLGRRPGGSSWLQQVCVATALFVCLEYVVSRSERAFVAERLPRLQAARVEQPGVSREHTEATLRGGVQFWFFFNVAAQLALFGGLAIALGRRSVGLELAGGGGTTHPSERPPPSERDDDG